MAMRAEDLREKLGEDIVVEELPDLRHDGHVDDFCASSEWSTGGLVHVHLTLWIVGAPRIDKVVVERQGKVRRAKLTYLRERIGKKALAVKAKDVRRQK